MLTARITAYIARMRRARRRAQRHRALGPTLRITQDHPAIKAAHRDLNLSSDVVPDVVYARIARLAKRQQKGGAE